MKMWNKKEPQNKFTENIQRATFYSSSTFLKLLNNFFFLSKGNKSIPVAPRRKLHFHHRRAFYSLIGCDAMLQLQHNPLGENGWDDAKEEGRKGRGEEEEVFGCWRKPLIKTYLYSGCWKIENEDWRGVWVTVHRSKGKETLSTFSFFWRSAYIFTRICMIWMRRLRGWILN